MYQPLKKSFKKAYPFKLCTTSFIYPDHLLPNVKMLAPFLDEIELLFFEGKESSRPSAEEIEDIRHVCKTFGTTCNIHLPLDRFPGHQDLSVRQAAIDTVRDLMNLTAPLSPSTYTLHLGFYGNMSDKDEVRRWQDRCIDSLKKILTTGMDSRLISIETLSYPFGWVEGIVRDLNLSVCIDVGHLVVHGFDVEETFNRHMERAEIIHLHGIKKGRDHLSLDQMDKETLRTVMKILKQYSGVVSLEVFSLDPLVKSLNFLDKCWR